MAVMPLAPSSEAVARDRGCCRSLLKQLYDALTQSPRVFALGSATMCEVSYPLAPRN
jgi:hypothetical protein